MHRTIVLMLAAFVSPVLADGTIKGRVVWPDKVAIPKNREVMVNINRAIFLAGGRKIYKNQLIVDPKNRGVKNVVFWLVDTKSPFLPLPLTAAAKKALAKPVEIDTPRGEFVPRMTVIAPGQKLVVKNSAAIPHNFNMIGGREGPSVNLLIRSGDKHEVGEVKSRLSPIPCSCTIHAWMKGYIIAAPSPYAAVTDADGNFEIKNAPKGTYRLIGWHEEIGWIFPKDVRTRALGREVEVKDGATTDLGKLERKVEDD